MKMGNHIEFEDEILAKEPDDRLSVKTDQELETVYGVPELRHHYHYLIFRDGSKSRPNLEFEYYLSKELKEKALP